MSSPPVETAPTPSSNGAAPRADGRSIRVLRDTAELASVRDAWLRLRRDQVAVDPDFFEAALRADPKIVRPHLVVLEENGTAQAMLVARIERLELAVRAGYRTLYAPKVRSLTVVYGGILGDVDEQMFLLLLGSVRRALAEGEADVAIFRYLALDSPFHRIASTDPAGRQPAARRGLRDPLGADPPGLGRRRACAALREVAAKDLNWQSRKLEKDYEGRLSIRLFTEPSDLDEFFRDVETIAGRTYQRALGVAFGDTPAHRERTRVSMEQGWFRGYVLHLDGKPVAFHHGELYQGRFRLGSPGYDASVRQPEHRHLSAPAPDRRPLQARRRSSPRLRSRRRRVQAPVRDQELARGERLHLRDDVQGHPDQPDERPRSWRASAARRGSSTGSASRGRSSSVGARA